MADFASIGAIRLDELFASSLAQWREIWRRASADDGPGRRLFGIAGLSEQIDALLSEDALRAQLAAGRWRCVRALALNKSPASNWSLGWHQGRVIAVRERHSVEGFLNYTVKDGIVHVVPPMPLHRRMRTLRLHLNDTGPQNGQLLVLPGSHQGGRVTKDAAAQYATDGTAMACPASAGDVWLYATPIIHASKRARPETRRRVIQLDLAADDLPVPLEWLGIE